MDACITNYGWAMSNDITFHTKISIKNIIIIQRMSAIGEPNEMGSVDNDGGIAKGDPMKKSENEGSEELEEYDDYYDDLEACDDGNRRACRNAKFRQQLYEDMLVEKEKESDCHNAHIAVGKKAEKGGKWNRDLEIIVDEDEVPHKEAHERAWNAQLELSTFDGEKRLERAKRELQKQWDNVQYRCELSRKHYIACRKIPKRSAGHAKDLEKKFK
jgi:hypothetical protein